MLHMAYVFYIYMFGFILPVAIIFTSYLKIIKTIKLKVKYLPHINYKCYYVNYNFLTSI